LAALSSTILAGWSIVLSGIGEPLDGSSREDRDTTPRVGPIWFYNGVQGVAALLGIFAVHRICTFRYLRPDEGRGLSEALRPFLVGIFSDVWIAALGAVLIVLVGMAVPRRSLKMLWLCFSGLGQSLSSPSALRSNSTAIRSCRFIFSYCGIPRFLARTDSRFSTWKGFLTLARPSH